MRHSILLLTGMTILVACGPGRDAVTFDGHFYRASLDTNRGSREAFTLSVRPVSASLLGAKEAGRYEATIYCVNRYGRSDINWEIGPDDPDETLPISNDTLILQGKCRE
ncbi:MAG: hypothetical protein AAGF27_12600 [Pseudomonadota bacterium]